MRYEEIYLSNLEGIKVAFCKFLKGSLSLTVKKYSLGFHKLIDSLNNK